MAFPEIQHRLKNSGLAERFRTRAWLWAQLAPQARDELLERIEDDRQCRFILPGSEGRALSAGTPPLWKENPTLTRNPEWVWELNRLYHWPRLLLAHALGLEQNGERQVLQEWGDWIAVCPVPKWDNTATSIHTAFNSPTPWRTLEAGLRMEKFWSYSLEALSDSSLIPSDLVAKIIGCFQDHGRVLAAIPPILWPKADHNHYLTENAGLLRLSLLLPELPEATAWREQAWRELGRCLENQITPDGGQIEGCPHYHNICVQALASVTLLAREQGLSWPAPLLERLHRALDYTLHSCRPDALNVSWGDSDATASNPLLAALLMSLALDARDQLAVLQRLAAPADWQKAVAESIWHAPDPRAWLKSIENLKINTLPPRGHHQRQLDQVMLRTDWTRDAASLFFCCHTPVDTGHAHIDPASFDFSAFGRTFVVDPGRYTYGEIPDRYTFKSASYHNTVTIDQRDPYAYVKTFDFGPQQKGRIVFVGNGPGWQAAASEQENFFPAIHRRLLVLLDQPPSLLVLDIFENLEPSQTVQLWFHLDSTQIALDPSQPSAETRDLGLVNLRVVGSAGLKLETHPGRVSQKIDVAHPSSRLCFCDPGGPARRVYLTHLIPRAADAVSWPKVVALIEPSNGPFPTLCIEGLKITLP